MCLHGCIRMKHYLRLNSCTPLLLPASSIRILNVCHYKGCSYAQKQPQQLLAMSTTPAVHLWWHMMHTCIPEACIPCALQCTSSHAWQVLSISGQLHSSFVQWSHDTSGFCRSAIGFVFNLKIVFIFVATAAAVYDACMLCVLIASRTYRESCSTIALRTFGTCCHTLSVVQVGPAIALEAPHMGRTLGPCRPFLIS